MLYHAVNLFSGWLRVENCGFPWAQPQSAPGVLVGYRSQANFEGETSMRTLRSAA
jgi:hypothetical protein